MAKVSASTVAGVFRIRVGCIPKQLAFEGPKLSLKYKVAVELMGSSLNHRRDL